MEAEYEKMMTVTVYCDSTDLFTDDEIAYDNTCDLVFPEEIVREWYAEFEEMCIAEQEMYGYTGNEISFETWINHVYDCDGTDGLYWFAKEKGFQPKRWES